MSSQIIQPAPVLPPGDPINSKRLDGVDLLRGIAIFFVVMNHVHMRLFLAEIPYAAHIPEPLLASLVWNGQFGVQIFFAVSGFLITSTALRRWGSLHRVNIREFYLLRFARIAPLLLALLAVLTALHFAGLPSFVVPQKTGGLGRAVFAALTFHLNVLEAHRGWLPGAWDILWSLSVEEMFYLFFPLVARFFGRGKFFIAILLVFVALGPFGRTLLTHGNEIWAEKSYLGGMDAIALGCLTALLVARTQFSRNALRAFTATGAALILFILVGLRFFDVPLITAPSLDMTIIGIGTCLVIIAAAQTRWRSPRILAPLRHLGQHSYEIYLTHMFMVFAFFYLFMRYHPPLWTAALLFLFTLVAAAILGSLVARLFSEPANLALRRRFSAPDQRSPQSTLSRTPSGISLQ